MSVCFVCSSLPNDISYRSLGVRSRQSSSHSKTLNTYAIVVIHKGQKLIAIAIVIYPTYKAGEKAMLDADGIIFSSREEKVSTPR